MNIFRTYFSEINKITSLVAFLSTEYGLTGWETGEAQKAAITAFQS